MREVLNFNPSYSVSNGFSNNNKFRVNGVNGNPITQYAVLVKSTLTGPGELYNLHNKYSDLHLKDLRIDVLASNGDVTVNAGLSESLEFAPSNMMANVILNASTAPFVFFNGFRELPWFFDLDPYFIITVVAGDPTGLIVAVRFDITQAQKQDYNGSF